MFLKDATITLCCELNNLAVANDCIPVVLKTRDCILLGKIHIFSV